jgi:large repetitive protein
MNSRWLWVIIAGVVLSLLASCGGGNGIDPSSFHKLSARVTDATGQPLAGVAVRVEGRDTGVTTDANGNFELLAAAFPNGVDGENELSFGRGGAIYGSEEIVPGESGDGSVTIQIGPATPGGGDGTSSLSGIVYDEAAQTVLPGVEMSLFSVDGGVYVTQTDAQGAYLFENLPAGDWQLAAYKDGYYPEMSAVQIAEGAQVVQDLALTARGVIVPGEGLTVKGVLKDAATNAPVGGATVTLYADTGYMGIAETGLYDDVKNDIGTEQSAPAGGTGMGNARGGSMMAPFYYDPQYQETTTNADGSFEFPNAVIGYAIWMNMSAEGYLNGSWYQSIDGLTDELNLNLTIEPIIPTSISGRIIDEDGNPIEGAYVEFVYGMGGPVMGMDVPAGIDVMDMAQEGQATRDNTNGTPPPPAMMGGTGGGDSAGWEDYSAGAPTDTNAGSGGGADNMLMQDFLFKQRNSSHSSSAAEPFTGYFSATTDANGEYSFTDVPVGQYYVFASAYRHLTYNADFEAQEDPALNVLEISLPNVPVGAVEGVVTDENGTPLPDVLVNCTQPNVDPFTYTDAGGHFSIENVPAGDWIVSAYKQGYLTVGVDTPILEDQTVVVNITINTYQAPEQETLMLGGRLADGMTNAGLANADMVFTPVDNALGGDYYRHVVTATDGSFNVDLIANGEYNLLVQKEGYQDLYIRIFVDPAWPQMEYMLWPVGAQGGGWGGNVPSRPPDGSGQTDPGEPVEPPSGDEGSVTPL